MLAVAAGGAIGAVARYAVALATQALMPTDHVLAGFPVATLLVNIIGCFVIGFASYFFIHNDFPSHETWRLFSITGVLGGFTTFSAFSLETVELFQAGSTGFGIIYLGASLTCCLVGVVAGRFFAHVITKG